MITSNEVEGIVNEAEEEFRRCWSKMGIIRARTGKTPEYLDALITFQPSLGTALFKLETLFDGLCRENRTLAQSRPNLNQKWYRRRECSLQNLKHIVGCAIDVGKVI